MKNKSHKQKKPIRALLTLATEKYNLKNVGDLISFLEDIQVTVRFPIKMVTECCGDKLIIRSFDDFPKKSIICKCGTTYLLQITKDYNEQTTC